MEGRGGERQNCRQKESFLGIENSLFPWPPANPRRASISHSRNRSIFPDHVALHDFSAARNSVERRSAVYKCWTREVCCSKGGRSKFEGSDSDRENKKLREGRRGRFYRFYHGVIRRDG